MMKSLIFHDEICEVIGICKRGEKLYSNMVAGLGSEIGETLLWTSDAPLPNEIYYSVYFTSQANGRRVLHHAGRISNGFLDQLLFVVERLNGGRASFAILVESLA